MAAVDGLIPEAGERPGTVAEAFGAVVVVVLVAGAVAGLVAAAGAVVVVLAGAVAGLVAVVGGAAGLFGGGGGWPKVLKAMVTEKRLAISVVFIELIGK